MVAGEEPVVAEPPETPGVTVLRTHQPGNPLASEQTCWLLGIQSAEDVLAVQSLIRAVSPQVVLVDLCASHQDALRRQGPEVSAPDPCPHSRLTCAVRQLVQSVVERGGGGGKAAGRRADGGHERPSCECGRRRRRWCRW